jgi:hypothetical protein
LYLSNFYTLTTLTISNPISRMEFSNR